LAGRNAGDFKALHEDSTNREEDSMRIPKLLFAAAAVSLAGCDTVPPAPGPIAPAPVAATSLTTANKAPFGTYLVDSAGRAVYVLEGEHMPEGMHRCTGACLAVWPPLMNANPMTAGAGVNPALIGSMPMPGGVPHVTYAGWPLYYYSHDTAQGDTNGQHLTDSWGTWHLLSPSGQPIRPAGGY
jgi:predicted lipoprotein with Yx(FWY)xxD motif